MTSFGPCFEPGTPVTIRNGRFHACGVIVGPAENGKIMVEALRNKFAVPAEFLEVGTMQVVTPRLNLSEPEPVLALRAELKAMADVVALQMETIDAAQKRTAAVEEWVVHAGETEDLVIALCLALGHGRHPITTTGIPELDALVAHVLG